MPVTASAQRLILPPGAEGWNRTGQDGTIYGGTHYDGTHYDGTHYGETYVCIHVKEDES